MVKAAMSAFNNPARPQVAGSPVSLECRSRSGPGRLIPDLLQAGARRLIGCCPSNRWHHVTTGTIQPLEPSSHWNHPTAGMIKALEPSKRWNCTDVLILAVQPSPHQDISCHCCNQRSALTRGRMDRWTDGWTEMIATGRLCDLCRPSEQLERSR